MEFRSCLHVLHPIASNPYCVILHDAFDDFAWPFPALVRRRIGVNQYYIAWESFLLSKVSNCAWCAAHHCSLALRSLFGYLNGLGLACVFLLARSLCGFVFVRYDDMSVMKTCVQNNKKFPDEKR